MVLGLVLGLSFIGFVQPVVVPVGTLFAYTGPLAEFGPHHRNASDLAAKQINEAATAVFGGPIIELIHEDTATDPKVGVDMARKLVEIHGVPAIVGALASGVTIPIAETVTIPAGVLQISNASTSPLITVLPADEGQDFLFRTTASDALQGVVLGRVAIMLGYKTASTIYVDNPYGFGLSEEFAAEFERLGGKVLAKVPHPEEPLPSYVAELEKALAGDPDVLVAISYPGHATIYLKEAIEIFGYTSFLYCDGTKSFEIIEAIGAEFLEGQLGTAPGADPRRATYKRFAEAFLAEYGELPPLPFMDTAYDAVTVIALAVAKAMVDGAEITGESVRDRLRDVSNPPGELVGVGELEKAFELIQAGVDIDWEGAAGSVNFDAAGDVLTPMVVWKYSEGDIKDLFVVVAF
jgi:ABC-type branched-subunit amino acid transport system substrate-binding protein